ncbi:serine protein kinase RIO [Microbacterium allomyrinae]|uniref:non-specific serine/threonine protein kinase n=1 Tax=Microbacterium allomyrinae TaxID=2830666 RepID=A0A9X1LYD2_9MICO|nr:RIO1 family regulatory kinase/ATPase [Microbacterium allomyrinae]MCC2034142.1 serine/threonine protein kinase [Microbacterium allomyrinae]
MSSLRFDASFHPASPDHAASGDSVPEPGPDQRWSTWPASPPTQRGPLPHPDWLVTASGAFDTELGVVKTGKEADVHLIERAVPGRPGSLLAAKRYRTAQHSDFHRSGSYEEGRAIRNTRDARAVHRKTSYGRGVAAGHWAGSEFAALTRGWQAGLPVPYPVQVSETEVLMEFIGDGRVAAPRLAQSRLHGSQLAGAYDQVVGILETFARAGFAHGDLSPYNLLEHHGRVVVIDLPQIVDVAANPQGLDFLYRDVVNVSTWFARRGLDTDPEALFGDLVGALW